MSEQTSARWLTPPRSNSSFRHSMQASSSPEHSRRWWRPLPTKSKLSFSSTPRPSRHRSAVAENKSAAEPGPAPAYPITSVDNARRPLMLFRREPRIRLSGASELLGVAHSTAHRLMAKLTYHGFVRQQPESRAYVAGPALVERGRRRLGRRRGVRAAAGPGRAPHVLGAGVPADRGNRRAGRPRDARPGEVAGCPAAWGQLSPPGLALS